MKRTPIPVRTMLADQSVPLLLRKKLLAQICAQPTAETEPMLQEILEGWTQHEAKDLLDAKLAELDAQIAALEGGPLRQALFVELLESPRLGRRAKVLLGDGGSAYCTLAHEELASELRRGEIVLLDAQGRAVLHATGAMPATGEVARLERDLGDGRVEVSRQQEARREVCQSSEQLRRELESGQAREGCSVLVCAQRGFAFASLPDQRGAQGSEFLLRRPPPDVRIERDLGDPKPFLNEIVGHMRREMRYPELARRYRLSRSRMVLLSGVSGSGKSLHVQALHRALYELMAEVTGASLDELPPRVIKLSSAMLLSKWLGESDQRIARCFDAIEELAQQKWRDAAGREHELPVLVVMEEADGLARQRGGDAIYDRIQTGLLEHLDATTQSLRERLIVFVFSTNVPHLVDSAFLRRAGGTVVSFGRLSRHSLAAVLDKLLRGMPLAGAAPREDAARRKALVGEVCARLHGRTEAGQVELTFVGSATPVVKHRRDFLTAGLIERAVQEAAAKACADEERGALSSGISGALLEAAITRHVRHIVDQLDPANVASYLTLPDGVRVGAVRRIAAPRIAPFELELEEVPAMRA